MFERFFAKLKNYKLIRFSDGNYGIRKGIFYYMFIDIKEPCFWWKGNLYTRYCKDCRGPLEKVVNIFDALQNTNNDYVVVPFKTNRDLANLLNLEASVKKEQSNAL